MQCSPKKLTVSLCIRQAHVYLGISSKKSRVLLFLPFLWGFLLLICFYYSGVTLGNLVKSNWRYFYIRRHWRFGRSQTISRIRIKDIFQPSGINDMWRHVSFLFITVCKDVVNYIFPSDEKYLKIKWKWWFVTSYQVNACRKSIFNRFIVSDNEFMIL